VLHSPRFMRDHRTCEGSIDQNPLHLELLEIASMARHDFWLTSRLQGERDSLLSQGCLQGTPSRRIAKEFDSYPR